MKCWQSRSLHAIALLCAGVSLAMAEIEPEELRPDPCNTAQACLDRVFQLAECWPGYRGNWPYPPAVVELGMSIAELEEDLTADLVALLLDKDRYVANVAGLVLSKQSSIDSDYLDEILWAIERGVEGSGGALGRVDSSDAAELVVRRAIGPEGSDSAAYQFAASLQGARAIPFIVKAARCSVRCDDDRHARLASILEGMGPERAEAGDGLLAIAADDASPQRAREGALAMIAELGPEAVELDEELLALKAAVPGLEAHINRALIGLESDAVGEIFAERLSSSPKLRDMYELASLREAGYLAGPVVEDLLSHPDWDIRLQAVRTLALIGYEPAVDSLLEILAESEDVVLDWVIADSMAYLNAFKATDALVTLSVDHWHPHVRERARLARERLFGSVDFDKQSRTWSGALVAYSQQVDAMNACDELDVEAADHSDALRLQHPEDEAELRMLSYPDELAGDSTVRGQNGVLVPGVAVRVDGGWLVGSDRGEWGGELVFIDRNGHATALISENIENLVTLDDGRIVAVTGLGHMFTSRGMLYLVEPSPGGNWTATRWRRLPGAPRSSSLTRSGELLVSTSRGGSLLVSPQGEMRMAPCVIPKENPSRAPKQSKR